MSIPYNPNQYESSGGVGSTYPESSYPGGSQPSNFGGYPNSGPGGYSAPGGYPYSSPGGYPYSSPGGYPYPGDAGAGYRPYPNYRPGYDPNASDKSRLVALLLWWFFGILGVHRFYVGKAGTGIAMIFTFGGFGIWAIIDLIMIAAGAFTDIDGRSITQWDTAR